MACDSSLMTSGGILPYMKAASVRTAVTRFRNLNVNQDLTKTWSSHDNITTKSIIPTTQLKNSNITPEVVNTTLRKRNLLCDVSKLSGAYFQKRGRLTVLFTFTPFLAYSGAVIKRWWNFHLAEYTTTPDINPPPVWRVGAVLSP